MRTAALGVAILAHACGGGGVAAQERPAGAGDERSTTAPDATAVEPIVARVDGAAIEARELRLFVARHRAATIAYFQRRHGLEDLRGAWSREFDGETPIAHLRERSLRECVRHRIERRLAVEQRVIPRADYAFVVEQLELENRRRKEALAAGERVFGVVQFTAETWYRRFHSDLVRRTKTRLGSTTLRPAEAALEAERAARGAEFGRDASPAEVRQFLVRQQVDQAYEQLVDGLVAKARVDVNDEVLGQLEM